MAKTILITGSTDGIGLLTAKMLSEQGHLILLHGRNPDKLRVASDEIGGLTESYIADLSSLEDVKRLAKDIRSKHDRLDVLINNAGVYKTQDPILSNGQDIRFVVNTLAPYALTRDLLPIMPNDGRIINLSSAAQAPVDIDALRGDKRVGDMAAYAQSKLAITIWSQELAKTLPDGPVVLSVNPGSLLATKMVKEGFGVAGHDLRIGADILCRLALDKAYETESGRYWDNDLGGFASPNNASSDKDVAQILMRELKKLA